MSNANSQPLSETPFDTQCEILTEMWLNYRDEESVAELFEFFDIGFPLAFAHNQGLVKLEPVGKEMVSNCWAGVIESFGHEQDTGFETLSDLTEDEFI